jgi:hypothetical protein
MVHRPLIIESAIEEFEEAWSVTERLVKQLIAP